MRVRIGNGWKGIEMWKKGERNSHMGGIRRVLLFSMDKKWGEKNKKENQTKREKQVQPRHERKEKGKKRRKQGGQG